MKKRMKFNYNFKLGENMEQEMFYIIDFTNFLTTNVTLLFSKNLIYTSSTMWFSQQLITHSKKKWFSIIFFLSLFKREAKKTCQEHLQREEQQNTIMLHL